MIGFARSELLLLALPWLLFWLWWMRRQRASCEWVWENVHERFRERFTLYRRETLGRRLAVLLALGLLLVLAAAGPRARGETEVRELASRVVLLLDGSASMLADDVPVADGSESRFERGRKIAVELGRRLEGSRFALVVFSGVSALQLPMTSDPATIEEALGAASFHTFYRSSGSSFTAALDSVLHFVEPGRGDLQAVLLSDGEQPFAETYDEPLAALEEAGVPVHAVAIGSREGQTRLIFDFRDVVAGKEEKTVLREYTTRREARHLKRIAGATGGRFTLAEGGAAEKIAAAIERRIRGAESVSAEGWRDLGFVPLVLFLVGFLLEAMVWGRRGKRREDGFDIERLGRDRGRPAAAAGLLLLLATALATLACRDDSPSGRASRENERGVAADALGSWPQARIHYDRSRAFGVRPEIPAYNLARSVTQQEDWSEAHDLYQDALELSPRLAAAHYNDGHVLYRWGEAELDLERCELERTLELWDAARRRFAGAAGMYPEESAGRSRARANLEFVGQRATQIEEACAPPPPAGGGGEGESEQQGGGEDESGGGAAGGEQQAEGGGEGEDGGDGGGETEGQGGGAGEERESEGGDEGESEGGGGEQEGEGEEGSEEERQGGGSGEDEGEAGEGEGQGESGGDGEERGEGGGEEEDQGESGGEEEDRGESGGEGEGQGDAGGEEEDQGRGGGGGGEADGRYHFRSLPEQFPKEVWESPEAEIWW